MNSKMVYEKIKKETEYIFRDSYVCNMIMLKNSRENYESIKGGNYENLTLSSLTLSIEKSYRDAVDNCIEVLEKFESNKKLLAKCYGFFSSLANEQKISLEIFIKNNTEFSPLTQTNLLIIDNFPEKLKSYANTKFDTIITKKISLSEKTIISLSILSLVISIIGILIALFEVKL